MNCTGMIVNELKSHCTTSKVVNALLFEMHGNCTKAPCDLVQASVGKHIAFATCVWGVINSELTSAADHKGSANGMQCRKPHKNIALPYCILV